MHVDVTEHARSVPKTKVEIHISLQDVSVEYCDSGPSFTFQQQRVCTTFSACFPPSCLGNVERMLAIE